MQHQHWYAVRFPYDAEFVQQFKKWLAPNQRVWDKPNKRWLVRVDAMPTLNSLLEKKFGYQVQFERVEVEDALAKLEVTQEELAEMRQELEASRGEVAFLMDFVQRLREEREQAPFTHPDFSTLHLLPDAPIEVIDAVYKALVKLHHPDRGGDTRRMQAVNAAVDSVRKRVQR